jgi:hypothetical protein
MKRIIVLRYRNRLEAQVAINHDHLADDHTMYLLADNPLFRRVNPFEKGTVPFLE